MKTTQVIEQSGRVARNNDGSLLLMASRAHALRIVRWLGFDGRLTIRPATDIEIAQGRQTKLHQVRAGEVGPGW